MSEKKNMFQIMKSAIDRTFIPNQSEMNQINSFLFTRWISNHPFGIKIAEFINNSTDVPINAQYWLARSTLQSVRYIAYPKKEDTKDKDIQLLSEHYNINYSLAREYHRMLPKEELEKIKNKYRHIGRTK